MSIKTAAVSIVLATTFLAIIAYYQGSSASNNLVSERSKVYLLFEQWLKQNPKQYQSNQDVRICLCSKEYTGLAFSTTTTCS